LQIGSKHSLLPQYITQSLSSSHLGGQELFITSKLPGHILTLLIFLFVDCFEKNDEKSNHPAINNTSKERLMVKYFLDIQLVNLNNFIY
jgi:hypothetical protein